jgi:hypothetical protein
LSVWCTASAAVCIATAGYRQHHGEDTQQGQEHHVQDKQQQQQLIEQQQSAAMEVNSNDRGGSAS